MHDPVQLRRDARDGEAMNEDAPDYLNWETHGKVRLYAVFVWSRRQPVNLIDTIGAALDEVNVTGRPEIEFEDIKDDVRDRTRFSCATEVAFTTNYRCRPRGKDPVGALEMILDSLLFPYRVSQDYAFLVDWMVLEQHDEPLGVPVGERDPEDDERV